MDTILAAFRESGRATYDLVRKVSHEEGSKIVGTNPLGQKTLKIDALIEDAQISILKKHGVAGVLITEEKGHVELDSKLNGTVIGDPLDGSSNHLLGIPVYCTGLAYSPTTSSKDITHSYIMNLVTGDEYWAIKGTGAFLNGNRIQTSKRTKLSESRFSIDYNNVMQDFGDVLPIVTKLKDIRRSGAALMDLCWLASGAIDGYIIAPEQLSVIHAVGVKIIEEAGGVVRYFGPQKDDIKLEVENKLNIACFANKSLYEQSLPLLKVNL